MKAKGVLYTVEGSRGVYYAIHDPATSRVWTERTESAALAQARELGILIAAEELITADELLRRTGRDAPERMPMTQKPAASQDRRIPATDPQQPLRAPEPELDVAPPTIPGTMPEAPIVASRMDVGASFFATDLPIATLPGDSPFEHLPPPPPLQGFATLHGDVLDPTRRDM